MSDTKQLSESEVAEINETIATLQHDITEVKDNVQKHDFNNALKSIVKGMSHTTCPLCKEKLAVLSADVIKAKVACKTKDARCDMIIKQVSDSADNLKDEFIPIATQKKFEKDKSNQPTNKGAIEQLIEMPITLPTSILDRLVPRKK